MVHDVCFWRFRILRRGLDITGAVMCCCFLLEVCSSLGDLSRGHRDRDVRHGRRPWERSSRATIFWFECGLGGRTLDITFVVPVSKSM